MISAKMPICDLTEKEVLPFCILKLSYPHFVSLVAGEQQYGVYLRNVFTASVLLIVMETLLDNGLVFVHE